MPHCSSEHEEEQFESMVGGSALGMERALTVPTQSTQSRQTISSFSNNMGLPNLEQDEEFEDLLKKISLVYKNVDKGNKNGPNGTGSYNHNLYVYVVKKNPVLDIGYTTEWITVEEFIELTKHSELTKDSINIAQLTQDIDNMIEGVIPPVLIETKIKSIIASSILDSYSVSEQIYLQGQILSSDAQAVKPFQVNEESETISTIFKEISKKFFDKFINSYKTLLSHAGENTEDYINFKNKYKKLYQIFKKKFEALKFPKDMIQNIISYMLQTGTIVIIGEFIRYFYDPNLAIRAYAGYGLVIILLKIKGKIIRGMTPKDEYLHNLDGILEEGVHNINVTFQQISDDLKNTAPIHQTINQIIKLKEFLNSGNKSSEIASSALVEAAINLCDGLEKALKGAETTNRNIAERVSNLEEAKKMLIILTKVTSGLNSLNEVPAAADQMEVEEKDPQALREEARKFRETAKGMADQEQAEALEAEAETLEARAEELQAERRRPKRTRIEQEEKEEEGEDAPNRMEIQGEAEEEAEEERPSKKRKKPTTRGGAPKRTKKVKSKMLKGKSKKHLKKAKKGKKTGKKVRFHPSSKKSKKNTRKRR